MMVAADDALYLVVRCLCDRVGCKDIVLVLDEQGRCLHEWSAGEQVGSIGAAQNVVGVLLVSGHMKFCRRDGSLLRTWTLDTPPRRVFMTAHGRLYGEVGPEVVAYSWSCAGKDPEFCFAIDALDVRAITATSEELYLLLGTRKSRIEVRAALDGSLRRVIDFECGVWDISVSRRGMLSWLRPTIIECEAHPPLAVPLGVWGIAFLGEKIVLREAHRVKVLR